ncbi:thioredoxin domain-containing protein [Tenacibaculum sp. 190524A05c]|uniref:Thioredox_DsbH domain-containing protein n=1 Tax=Tenacibaculum platacis TaxID=3137852 RepID=A0ABM9P4L7_9FLAO
MRFNHNILFYSIIILLLFSCSQQKEKHTNSLIHESSPYLLQHSHNPVNWFPWDAKYLEKAKEENKLVLLSIGYSSCHWCHVMEEETFEDEEVAKFMNENFINIKIDREEHPDVDKTYMTAVQIMTGNGGWPLNCVILPNGKPVWGGTYFEKDEWLENLKNIQLFYTNNPEKTDDFAEQLANDMRSLQVVDKNNSETNFSKETLDKNMNLWFKKFDTINFGLIGSNQFPRPNNYQFLLRYAYQNNDTKLLNFVTKTLDKMALGGLHDHLEGGFARYTVDNKWHIPHFEKMLYDNAQLLSLYSIAYQITKKPLYKEIVYKTIEFIEKEFHTNGLYYSSLNADSFNKNNELEEGTYYTWTNGELISLITQNKKLFDSYYGINEIEKVEGKSALVKRIPDSEFAKANKIPVQELKNLVMNWNKQLLVARLKRQKPSLDTKILTSWNALLLQGYVDAFKVFGDAKFKEKAIQNGLALKNEAIDKTGNVLRTIGKGNKKIDGYLEDYALLINAYISLYQITLNEDWLNISNTLAKVSFDNFFDTEQELFKYSTKKNSGLIANNFEIEDIVIPSSNSVMSKNLLFLGHYFDNKEHIELSKNMLHNMETKIEKYPHAYSNWLDNYLNFTAPYYETVICGKDAVVKTKELFQTKYIPNMLVSGSTQKSELTLLLNRYNADKTLIYVCVNKACKLPTEDIDRAVQLMKN